LADVFTGAAFRETNRCSSTIRTGVLVTINHRPAAGIFFCVFSLLAFALQDSIVKGLSVDYPVLQILSFRSLVSLTLMVSIGLISIGPSVLVGRNRLMLYGRGALAFMAFTTYYVALQKIPLADAAAVYMTAPLFVTLLSALILRERVGMYRWLAVLVGFLAVIFMLNPGGSLFQVASIMPLFSAMCYAFIPIINRHIGTSQAALTMGIYTSVTYLLLILLTSALIYVLPRPDGDNEILGSLFRSWQWFTMKDLLINLFSGCLFTIGLLSITQAYRIAIVSAVAPFEYSYLLWASLIGYLYFGDVPGADTIIGGLVVVSCGCFIIYRENRLTKASR
jgi:drug/metabolite transporter (DMT)-like permease